jgi:hypothetical protein
MVALRTAIHNVSYSFSLLSRIGKPDLRFAIAAGAVIDLQRTAAAITSQVLLFAVESENVGKLCSDQ